MTGSLAASLVLEADLRNVRKARVLVREQLAAAGLEDLVDSAELAVTEVVTNAFVHTGTTVEVRLHCLDHAVRVEVDDGSPHLPVRRRYATTAGTGRGLTLVDEVVTRWGTQRRSSGKTIWFEIGETGDVEADADPGTYDGDAQGSASAHVAVTLRRVPLLMHLAWQEHAATLLREHLLRTIEQEPEALARHADASDAMTMLADQLPVPRLNEADPDALMADAVEPGVSASEVLLLFPPATIANFAVLDDLLARAVAEARAGLLLRPPTQPEIEEMREWLCGEVRRQAAGTGMPTPWVARTDVRATLADQTVLAERYAALAATDEAILATDEASIIVAASSAALEVLGYSDASELIGQRVIAVVPHRFHQAHIAGTTLHVTNGRDTLLDVEIAVPMVRADGSEIDVDIRVSPEAFGDERVFMARFRPRAA